MTVPSAAVANPVAALPAVRPVGLARLHPAQPHRGRRAEAAGGRGRPGRRDLEPRHLREGHRRQQRLRGGHRARSRRTPGLSAKEVYERLAVKDIQDAADVLRAGLRPHEGAGRLREPRGLARPGQRHRRHAGGGAPALGSGGPAQRDDQGPGHARGRARHPAAHLRGHQRQRHPALRPRGLRGGGAGLHRGPGGAGRGGRSPSPRGQRGQLLREPHRHPGGRADRREARRPPAAPTRRASSRSWARWRSPTPSSPTRATRRSSRARAGRPSRAKGARCSACSGPARAPRTRAYSDVLYVEELIGPDTVNTVPPETLAAFRDHGRPRPTLEDRPRGRTGPPSTTSRRPASRSRRSPTSCSRTGSRSSWSPSPSS